MGRYYYPNAKDALSAKIQFLKEHHYKINHCFQNTWGTGYVLFDTKEEVNLWWKEHSGSYFYKEEYEPGTTFTESDAIKEIEERYGDLIDKTLASRDYTMPILAIGMPFATQFGNRMVLKFVKSTDEDDIEWRFYYHYSGRCLDVTSVDNATIRKTIIRMMYHHFYDSRFKKRIEGSKKARL